MNRTVSDIDARIRRQTDRLTEATGITFRYGYLGDVSGIPGTPAFRDSRSYYLFAAHPGRCGTDADRLGGVSDPADLLPILGAALGLARIQNTPR